MDSNPESELALDPGRQNSGVGADEATDPDIRDGDGAESLAKKFARLMDQERAIKGGEGIPATGSPVSAEPRGDNPIDTAPNSASALHCVRAAHKLRELYRPQHLLANA